MSETRENSRLEVEDESYCKNCGAKIEAYRDSMNGYRWDESKGDWFKVEECASCALKKAVEATLQRYSYDFVGTIEVSRTCNVDVHSKAHPNTDAENQN